MDKSTFARNKVITATIGGAVLFLLYLTCVYHYLLFHSLIDVFSILVAWGILTIAWNSRQFVTDNYLLMIGVAHFFVGFLDLLQNLNYKGYWNQIETYIRDHSEAEFTQGICPDCAKNL